MSFLTKYLPSEYVFTFGVAGVTALVVVLGTVAVVVFFLSPPIEFGVVYTYRPKVQ